MNRADKLVASGLEIARDFERDVEKGEAFDSLASAVGVLGVRGTFDAIAAAIETVRELDDAIDQSAEAAELARFRDAIEAARARL